jgi:hypothetical protein
MNSTIKKEFKKLFAELPNQHFKNEKLNVFSVKRSAQFNNNLMVVGPYIIGAHNDCKFESRHISQIGDHLITMLEKHEGAMNWVADMEDPRRKVAPNERRFSTRRIPFWRVSRQVAINSKQTTDICWSDQIAWTNLYKISKEEKNPNQELLDFQFKSAITILHQEIKDAKPKLILFLTGWEHWAQDFIGANIKDIKIINQNNVCLTGTLVIDDFSCKVIVAETANGKRESIMADEILKHI